MRRWLVGLALALSPACAGPQRQSALTAAAATASAGAVAVDAITVEVRRQVADLYEARVAPCQGEEACIRRARAAIRALPRVDLSERLVAAQHRAADAIEAGSRCADSDTACQATAAATATISSAEVTALLAELRRAPPIPTATETPAP